MIASVCLLVRDAHRAALGCIHAMQLYFKQLQPIPAQNAFSGKPMPPSKTQDTNPHSKHLPPDSQTCKRVGGTCKKGRHCAKGCQTDFRCPGRKKVCCMSPSLQEAKQWYREWTFYSYFTKFYQSIILINRGIRLQFNFCKVEFAVY